MTFGKYVRNCSQCKETIVCTGKINWQETMNWNWEGVTFDYQDAPKNNV